MTAVCPSGGASEPKPGFAAALQITPYGIGALLNNVPTPWAVALALGLGTVVYELNTFCLVDPPTLPTLVLQDGIDLLHPEILGPYLTARQKFQDFVGYYAWYQFCQCHTGTATPPGTPQAEPTGWPQTDPTGAGLPTKTQPCHITPTSTVSVSTGSNGFATTQQHWTNFDLTWIEVVADSSVSSGVGCTIVEKLVFHDINQTILQSVNFTIANTQASTKYEFPVPANAYYYEIAPVSQSGSGISTVHHFQNWFCGGQVPNQDVTPCCPPDPTLLGMLAQINAAVQLIQRQSAPFGYVYGTNHTGLGSNGSLAVSGLIGVSVELTTVPASYGSAAGTPDEIFDAGFVTLGTTDGYEKSRRLDHTEVLFVPPQAGVFTTIGYTLKPGIVASIRELVREP